MPSSRRRPAVTGIRHGITGDSNPNSYDVLSIIAATRHTAHCHSQASRMPYRRAAGGGILLHQLLRHRRQEALCKLPLKAILPAPIATMQAMASCCADCLPRSAPFIRSQLHCSSAGILLTAPSLTQKYAQSTVPNPALGASADRDAAVAGVTPRTTPPYQPRGPSARFHGSSLPRSTPPTQPRGPRGPVQAAIESLIAPALHHLQHRCHNRRNAFQGFRGH